MTTIKFIIDFILHIDTHLSEILSNYGTQTYMILFTIIFCETGLVFMPFLPGDSLLFASGALWATNNLNIIALVTVIFLAAVIGDFVNYNIGRLFGGKLLKQPWFIKLIRQQNIDKSYAFISKHGGKSIFLARFFPIIRTIVPFIVGAGNMQYAKFQTFSILGSLLWVPLFVFAGYFFGNIPIIKNNFTLVVFGIIGISLLPMIISAIKSKK